jgi:hypothetical protein
MRGPFIIVSDHFAITTEDPRQVVLLYIQTTSSIGQRRMIIHDFRDQPPLGYRIIAVGNLTIQLPGVHRHQKRLFLQRKINMHSYAFC